MTSEKLPSIGNSQWRAKAPDHPHILPIRAFQDNYIWLIVLETPTRERQAVVVDPGDAAPVLQALRASDLPLAGILVTHHHADHTGGIGQLKATWPQAVVYGPRKCANPLIDRHFDHGDRLTIDNLGIGCRVIEVPGHTLDHNAYFFDRLGSDPRPVLFCGDTLFAGGCGRIFEGTPAVMYESLARLAALPPQTLVYCAHEYTLSNLRFARAAEPANESTSTRLQEAESIRKRDLETVPSTLAIELESNPFLRVDQPSVRESVRRLPGKGVDLGDAVAVFARLRQWKNEFS